MWLYCGSSVTDQVPLGLSLGCIDSGKNLRSCRTSPLLFSEFPSGWAESVGVALSAEVKAKFAFDGLAIL